MMMSEAAVRLQVKQKGATMGDIALRQNISVDSDSAISVNSNGWEDGREINASGVERIEGCVTGTRGTREEDTRGRDQAAAGTRTKAAFSPKKVKGTVLYQGPTGYWVRPVLKDGKRVWRKVGAKDFTDALIEARDATKKHTEYLRGTALTSPFEESGQTFTSLSAMYLMHIAASCTPAYVDGERRRVASLCSYFGNRHPNEIRLRDLAGHRKWRVAQVRDGCTGARTVEQEWSTLANVQEYGVFQAGVCEMVWCKGHGRLCGTPNGKEQHLVPVRHAKDVAPASGDEVNTIGTWLLAHWPVCGWMWEFACLTGLRRSELLTLRVNETGHGPGAYDDQFLYVTRSKGSKDAGVLLTDELRDLIVAHYDWHRERVVSNPYYFPASTGATPMHKRILSLALDEACKVLRLPKRTPHGARSFYATVWRSQSLPERTVAARIGDRTTELITTTYGGECAIWFGGEALSFAPRYAPPCYMCWRELIQP